MQAIKILNSIKQAKNLKKVSIFSLETKAKTKILRFLVSEGFISNYVREDKSYRIRIRYSKDLTKSSIIAFNQNAIESLIKKKVKTSKNFNIVISSNSKGLTLNSGKLNLKIR
jgi:ribosomal protein S8